MSGNILEEYNLELAKRDTLDICEEELKELMQDENVQRFIKLKEYYLENIYLRGMSDDDILDEVIKKNPLPLKKYFCMGKNFIGLPRKIGTYYLVNPSNYKFAAIVSHYKNIYDEADQVIIPTDSSLEFEEANEVVFPKTDDCEEEYKILRREAYLELIKEKKKTIIK